MAYISFQPKDYFNTKLYSGDGQSTHAITGVGFQPDWVWIKKRSGTDSHNLVDAVRGVQKAIASNSTDAQTTYSNNLSAFGTDGFTVGSGNLTNDNGYTFASWNWLANGSGSANTDGSISSTVSASSTSGFSIVKYTGTGANATVGHGLGVAPKMILFKDTTNASTNWSVYHKSIGAGYRLTLNDTSAQQGSDSTYYQNTDPSSSVFYLGSNTRANASGAVTIAYCFAEKKGFSKFGTYTGNGNADGTFVYTGFKPAFIMFKDTSTAYDWMIFDNKRNGFNPDNDDLEPSNTSAESNTNKLDILSNGFKLRKADADANASGDTFIYMAFAEHPLVSSNDIPATAR